MQSHFFKAKKNPLHSLITWEKKSLDYQTYIRLACKYLLHGQKSRPSQDQTSVTP